MATEVARTTDPQSIVDLSQGEINGHEINRLRGLKGVRIKEITYIGNGTPHEIILNKMAEDGIPGIVALSKDAQGNVTRAELAPDLKMDDVDGFRGVIMQHGRITFGDTSQYLEGQHWQPMRRGRRKTMESLTKAVEGKGVEIVNANPEFPYSE